MRQNQGKQLVGRKVTLVPYDAAHVRQPFAACLCTTAQHFDSIGRFVNDSALNCVTACQVSKYHKWMVSSLAVASLRIGIDEVNDTLKKSQKLSGAAARS